MGRKPAARTTKQLLAQLARVRARLEVDVAIKARVVAELEKREREAL